ncbi:hypothetical protein [Klebsiella phage phiKp_21]|uniref:hypothetical protein n=1 Tax=Klebsiella phage K64-1 TaxID=1439894 RepID=UPI0018A47E98|nr:hypothetical protein ACQ27_gp318 [Klebsiella phage K64-1]QOE32665.1 hypothetical protein CPT_Muenster_499 [Klebsiella phage Muenster]UYL05144.1 hypothetical protein DIDNDMLP_00159 [Klebsiella phage KP13-7]BEH88473.1 hypothetical protein [Klebsiella phage phiKp_21]
MILSNEERKIVLQAMSLVHLTTEQERDLFARLKVGNDLIERKKASAARHSRFKEHMHTLYGPLSHLHNHEYYDFCKKNEF